MGNLSENRYITRYYDCDEGRGYKKVRLLSEAEFDINGRVVWQKVYKKASVYDLWQRWIKEYLCKNYPEIMYSSGLVEEITNQYLTRKDYKDDDIPYTLKKVVYREVNLKKSANVEYNIESDLVDCKVDGKSLFWMVIGRNEDCFRKAPRDVLEITANRILEQTKNGDVKIRVAEHVSEYHEFKFYKNGKMKSKNVFAGIIEQESSETAYSSTGPSSSCSYDMQDKSLFPLRTFRSRQRA